MVALAPEKSSWSQLTGDFPEKGKTINNRKWKKIRFTSSIILFFTINLCSGSGLSLPLPLPFYVGLCAAAFVLCAAAFFSLCRGVCPLFRGSCSLCCCICPFCCGVRSSGCSLCSLCHLISPCAAEFAASSLWHCAV